MPSTHHSELNNGPNNPDEVGCITVLVVVVILMYTFHHFFLS